MGQTQPYLTKTDTSRQTHKQRNPTNKHTNKQTPYLTKTTRQQAAAWASQWRCNKKERTNTKPTPTGVHDHQACRVALSQFVRGLQAALDGLTTNRKTHKQTKPKTNKQTTASKQTNTNKQTTKQTNKQTRTTSNRTKTNEQANTHTHTDAHRSQTQEESRGGGGWVKHNPTSPKPQGNKQQLPGHLNGDATRKKEQTQNQHLLGCTTTKHVEWHSPNLCVAYKLHLMA